ncbi:effector-binding domain-containing protein [Virgibacillus subterraneus]|uniref:Effector-binding domain-containing protein n=1 Tax=Virgibacillus subterraneus TaxID=621109 RepID=A0A1H9JLY3_9BACI|nr:GyrI-like domain-containing protein [Virgibacillus subterraneus]SEQ87971.1 effector-binding domain-containing protein [Virgibacillus subterraneus]
MFKIGDFSKLSGLSINTLYHYENIGILEPRFIDGNTNYRYYEADQLVTINKVLALKDAGLSLSEISSTLIEGSLNKEIITMLEDKADSLEKSLELETNRLERLRTNIFLIKNGGVPYMNEISIKQVEPILVASVRKSIQKANSLSFDNFCESLWSTVNKHINKMNSKRSVPCLTMYHSGLFINTDSRQIDMEVVEPITNVIPESNDVKVYELPLVENMASIVHTGSLSTIGETSNTMHKWSSDNGYSTNGPVREIYHKGDWLTDNPDEFVTELQFPVRKD